MKTVFFLTAGFLVAMFASSMAQTPEKPWFDLVNCDFCKYLTEDTLLLENIAWEFFDLPNGVLSVTSVKPEFRPSYLKAMENMEKLGAEMTKGKTDVKMCGSCEHYGKMMAAGAKFEHFATKAGDIVMITSDKPEVLQMIKEYADNTRTELAKMEAAEKEKKP